MKKVLLSFILFFAILTSCRSNVFAETDPYEEQITLFKSDIELKQNTDIVIKEEIHYYLPSYGHGIIREIPVDYSVQVGFKRPTILLLDEIYYYEESNPSVKYDEYSRSSSNGYAIFKIGDADTSIQGNYVYVISYTLRYATNYFNDHDELYLNITGDGWNIPISKVEANISVPGGITNKVCYTGAYSSTLSDCTYTDISTNNVSLTTNNELGSYEGLTATIAMPKGTLADTTKQQIIETILANIGILLPIPAFILMYAYVKKKNNNKKLTVIPHYNSPKDIYPLLGGYIYSCAVKDKYISAQIIQMALDGYIKIKQEDKKNYTLVKNNTDMDTVSDSVKTLFTGLLGDKESINTKKISSDFYKTVISISGILSKEVLDKEYFSKKKQNLKGILLTIGIVGTILSFILGSFLATIAATGWTIGLIISSVIVIILSTKIDIRSEKGNKIYYELEGLKLYIDTAEEKRIEFHNDPKKYSGIFEKLLPYAMIFGLEKKWMKEFEDIYTQQPDWYQGDLNTFNSYVLLNSISNINNNVHSKSVASNSSAGFRSSGGASGGSGFSGGSSGGGFGGGGGGSW